VCTVHAIVTLAASVALVAAPGLIPSTMGIRLDRSAYLLAYLLAGAELGIAALSFLGRALPLEQARRVVVLPCVIFHASTAALEVVAFAQGLTVAIFANVVPRLVIITLFLVASRPQRAEA
jgi:hypothetical protein